MSTFPTDSLKKAFRWMAVATIAHGMFPWVAGATGIVGLSLGLIAPAQAQTAQLDSTINRNVFDCMKNNTSSPDGRIAYSGGDRGEIAVFNRLKVQQGRVGYNFVVTTPGRPAVPGRPGRPATLGRPAIPAIPAIPATPDQGRLELNYIEGPFLLTRGDFLGLVRNGLQNTANTTCKGK